MASDSTGPAGPLDPLSGLPPDLAELDAELAGLHIGERASFGPELAAELRRTARRPRPSRAPRARRSVAAAAAGAVLLVGLTVPPARASLVRAGTSLVRMLETSTEPAPPPTREAQPPVAPPETPAEAAEPERSTPDPSPAPAGPAAAERAVAEPFRPPEVTLPEILDERADARLMRRYYPPALEARGQGGTVTLLLWVDSTGSVGQVQISGESGLVELDRAALAAAPHLRFRPATHSGRPVGTWVEFPLTFEVVAPDPPATPPSLRLPDVLGHAPARVPEPTASAVVPAPTEVEADELLRSALGEGSTTEARFGTLEGLLEGEPPRGASPLAWRAAAAADLEQAMVRDPDNPAPYLALARIRRRQGLADEARGLVERGIRRAGRVAERVSPRLAADLHYELGVVLREAWLPEAGLGDIDPDVVRDATCARAADPLRRGAAGVGEALVQWSTLCPEQLDRVMDEGFRAPTAASATPAAVAASFEAAVDADPGHVGANVELLLELAGGERWYDLLNGARRFAWTTDTHPFALLFSGMALQRLGRAEEAADDLRRGLEGLAPEVAEALADPRLLMDAESAARFARLGEEGRRRVAREFWAPLDPILATAVNERFVEHLVRGAYAHLRFGGSATGPGEVWVRYGRPLRTRVLGRDAGMRVEFWDYGRGPDVTFRRAPSARTPDLTAEARAYLEDLRRVLSHRYRASARAVDPLGAQVARFLTEGGLELEVHAAMPEAVASSEADTVDVGLYQLGPTGERLAIDRRRVPAGQPALRFAVPAAPGATHLAVELFHAGLNRAYSLRERIARRADPRGSDLLLTAPAAPSRAEARRGLRRVVPGTRGDVLGGDRAGVLFELYDLPEGGRPYGLRVELVPSDGAEPIAVPFRPAGQTLFGDTWSRRPHPGPTRASEFVTVDLSGVPAGDYRLRVRVDLDGDAGELVLERPVRRTPVSTVDPGRPSA